MMNLTLIDLANLFLALSAGAFLGVFYFGALWLTVQRLTRAKRPGLLFLGSYVVRMAVTLVGFYLVMGGQWERLLACVAGFLLARQFLVRYLQPSQALPKHVIGE
jgi:F1F0 ATPase subunit 2